jgi:hypothetical protein
MPRLQITSSYFTIPQGNLTLNLPFETTTILAVKEVMFNKFGSDCPVKLQSLWWNGYALPDAKTIVDACVGLDPTEIISPSSDLVLFLTLNDQSGWVAKDDDDYEEDDDRVRDRKSSFDLRLESFARKEKKAGTGCTVS